MTDVQNKFNPKTAGQSQRKYSGKDRKLPDQSIKVSNMPGHIRVFIPSLPKGKEMETWDAIEEGNVISEIGFAEKFSLPCVGSDFLAFPLRERPSPKYLPEFVFGGIDLGHAYSAFQPRLVSLPIVGSKITLDPILTVDQMRVLQSYDYVRAEAMWVVQIPAPLGVAMVLRAYAPELDATTDTRGVRWKPNAVTAIAFHTSWSNDLAYVNKTTGRIGQSGLSIVLETIEDNSTDQVNTPLRATVWCAVYNIKGIVINHQEADWVGQALPGINFVPQSNTTLLK
ncbi:putative capsid protein [Myrmica rubra picorna-like virus 6]|nr:putative capsid protein [Myrmica rubra picorna-like virus 6]